MRRYLVLGFLVILFAFIVGIRISQKVPRTKEQSINVERFGTIKVSHPPETRGAALLFSGPKSSDSLDYRYAIEFLLAARISVFEIQAPTYLANVAKDDDGCVVLGGEVERLNQSLQNTLGFENFHKAFLLGVDEGAFVAAVARFQSPDRFEGTIASDLCAQVPSNITFCDTEQLKFLESKTLEITETLPETLSDFFSITSNTSCPKFQIPQPLQTGNTFIQQVRAFIPRVIEDSPQKTTYLVELPAEDRGESVKHLVLFFSGDGGWAGIDQDTGGYLQKQGMSVLGFNTLKYFWHRKTPEEATIEVEKILRAYKTQWKISKISFVGYSLGANVIPFIYNRMTPEAQGFVSSMVLLAPESKTDFQVHISDWILDQESETDLPLLPELRSIPSEKLLCVTGEDDDPGACQEIDSHKFKVQSLPGGHHFDGEYEVLGKLIEKFIQQPIT